MPPNVACEVAFTECFITDKLSLLYSIILLCRIMIYKSAFQRLKGIKLCAVNIRNAMDSTFMIRIAFLILILISCLTVYYMFGKGSQKEGFLIENTLVDFNDQGVPANPLYDEYGNPLTDGYYFTPNVSTGKWDTGAKDFKQYMLKSVPYGYVATTDKKSIVPKTNVATAVTENNIPEWRELTFAEYSQLPSSPFVGTVPPAGYFNIKQAEGKYKIAKIPVNHALLDVEKNPISTYLKYTGPYELSSLGEKDAPPSGKYKIRLVTEYNADNTPKTVVYAIADIQSKYELDKSDDTYTTLLARKSVTDAFPMWREWTFAEYSQVLSTPVGPNTPVPQGYFRIKRGDKYEIAKIPVNHRLLGPDALNPNKTYLSYSGAYQDIPGYTYRYNNQGSPDWTGEFALNTDPTTKTITMTTTPEPAPSGKYKIKLVTEYNIADNTPKKVKFVIADIPAGYVIDSSDVSQTKLVTTAAVNYDAASAKDLNFQYRPELPEENVEPDGSGNRPSMEAGVYYQFDKNGKLVEINYKESNFAPILYYMPGAYKFGSSAYVPTYEDSVYLSRETRNAQLLPGADPNSGLGGSPIINSDSQLGGFCTADKDNKQKMEEKCNAVDPASCASTTCCVLLGGEKCVSGNENGPYMTANYTDYTLTTRNKDFYYYQGKCYGNC